MKAAGCTLKVRVQCRVPGFVQSLLQILLAQGKSEFDAEVSEHRLLSNELAFSSLENSNMVQLIAHEDGVCALIGPDRTAESLVMETLLMRLCAVWRGLSKLNTIAASRNCASPRRVGNGSWLGVREPGSPFARWVGPWNGVPIAICAACIRQAANLPRRRRCWSC